MGHQNKSKSTANSALQLRAIFYNLFNDAFAVGSIVTIAVNIAKIGVRSSIKQNSDVKKVAKPVLILYHLSI